MRQLLLLFPILMASAAVAQEPAMTFCVDAPRVDKGPVKLEVFLGETRITGASYVEVGTFLGARVTAEDTLVTLEIVHVKGELGGSGGFDHVWEARISDWKPRRYTLRVVERGQQRGAWQVSPRSTIH
jgi:hypothetical protein